MAQRDTTLFGKARKLEFVTSWIVSSRILGLAVLALATVATEKTGANAQTADGTIRVRMSFAEQESNNMNSTTPIAQRSRRAEMFAVFAFVAVSLLAPPIVGEMYPFTVSPMFRDHPECYCTYELFDESGQELDLESYGLHLVYDGNPPGLGMGIEAASTLHGFGEVPDLKDVADHLRVILASQENAPREIRIHQTVVNCGKVRPEPELRVMTFSTDVSEAE